MRIWPTISIFIFCGVLTTLCTAKADELHLSNGDIISGQLIRMEENQLFFKTPYAGEIEVSWPDVMNLITEEPIQTILIDGTVLKGVARKTSVHKMRLETGKLEAPVVFELSEVAAINPGKKPVVKITARINAGLTQERGNSDADTVGFDGEFVARSDKNRYTLLGELNKEKSDGDTDVENWMAFGNYSYFLTQKWF